MDYSKMQVTNTVGFITLAENANGRNRSVDLNKLTFRSRKAPGFSHGDERRKIKH